MQCQTAANGVYRDLFLLQAVNSNTLYEARLAYTSLLQLLQLLLLQKRHTHSICHLPPASR